MLGGIIRKGKAAWYTKLSKISGKTLVFKRALETEWDIKIFWVIKPKPSRTIGDKGPMLEPVLKL